MPVTPGGHRPFRDHRKVIEGITYRFRTGIAWLAARVNALSERDLPPEFGPWQTVRERRKRFSADGTWDQIHAHLVALADARSEAEWDLSVDSTINRAHQRATTLARTPLGGTGGSVELHEASQRAAGRAG